MKTLQELLRLAATRPGQKGIYLIKGEGQAEHITYNELFQESGRLLFNINKKGISRGNQVIIQTQSDMNFIKIFWACILGGIVPVPVTFGLSEPIVDKVEKISNVLDNPFIITDVPDYEERIRATVRPAFIANIPGYKVVNWADLQSDGDQAMPEIAEDDIAFLQFSSGSTGNPKGVINTHRAILQNVTDISEADYIDEQDITMGWMPLTHDMGIISFHMMPLFRNFDQYLMSPMLFMAKPYLWMKSIADYNVTVSGAPNFGYTYYLTHCKGVVFGAAAFSRLRIIISGAEQINHLACKDFFKELEPFGMAPDIFRPTYGLAEATLYVTGQKNKGAMRVYFLNRNRLNIEDQVELVEDSHPDCVSYVNLGEPRSTQIQIRDLNGNVLPPLSIGIIYIKGPCVTKGYYNNPQETASLIDQQGWLNTGDLGFMDGKELVVTGRAKELIIVRGQNYYPNDIEEAIYNNNWIKDKKVASCGIYNESLRQDDVVVFITHHGPMADFIPVMQATRKAVFKKIGIEVTRVIPVDHLPRTTSGKIQRFKLRDELLQGKFKDSVDEISGLLLAQKPNQLSIPKTEAEKRISLIIATHLKVESINVRDNFFDLGASSIIVQAIKSDIEEEFKLTIDDLELYKYPNIRSFATYLAEKYSGTNVPELASRSTVLAGAKERLRKLEQKK